MFFHEIVSEPVVPVLVAEGSSARESVEYWLVGLADCPVKVDFNRRSASVVDTSTLLRALLLLPLDDKRLMGGMSGALCLV